MELFESTISSIFLFTLRNGRWWMQYSCSLKTKKEKTYSLPKSWHIVSTFDVLMQRLMPESIHLTYSKIKCVQFFLLRWYTPHVNVQCIMFEVQGSNGLLKYSDKDMNTLTLQGNWPHIFFFFSTRTFCRSKLAPLPVLSVVKWTSPKIELHASNGSWDIAIIRKHDGQTTWWKT